MGRAWCVAVLALALTGGCVTANRAVLLYNHAGPPRPRAEVARLTGPIRAVDGYEVDPQASSFELLPGCHVVQVGGELGRFDPNLGSGFAANLPVLFYAFRMQAGGSYSVDFERQPALGTTSVGWGYVVARATDATGQTTKVPHLRTQAELDECLRWDPRAK